MDREYCFDHFNVISRTPVYSEDSCCFTEEQAKDTVRFHRSLPFYHVTPLWSMSCAAKEYQIDSILVKDESFRFGLNAFKGLGGSYSMFRILCEKLGLDPMTTDFSTFQRENIRKACSDIEFVTTTDGNHGKGVSWAAGIFGCKAHVYMPRGTVEARRRAIETAGSATAEITDMIYDDTVRYTASLAKKNAWILIQDTSWPGYERFPRWIIEGYLTMGEEIRTQMNGQLPTHIFLQAGVGSMAGGLESYFMNLAGDQKPVVVIVEAKGSDCIYQSAQANDGKAHTAVGEAPTIMAGLNCGTPCGLVWPVLRDCTSLYVSCEDVVTEQGMRAYARPAGTDRAMVSGESGAVTYGLLRNVLESDRLREIFQIDKNSRVLLISTEGNTDPDDYARVLGEF
ncbi:MAG: diaminopropionate ammonia-lyase [Firmicutes bacterium]|nr:diaminopropionate ammonia-lyase [Bacillota bacterium]